MARTKRRPYNPTGPFVARRDFFFGGQKFEAGDPFPIDGIHSRRIRNMYDARRIDFAGDDVPSVEEIKNVFDWRTLNEEDLLIYAFEQTGTRFRSPARAVKALEDICPA